MKIAIAHYHLRPGGVTSVIRSTTEALREHTDLEAIVVAEGFDYCTSSDAPEPATLAARLHAAAPDADLWHVHNPTLGKHATFPDALALLDKPLLLQIHDFAEDGRPGNLAVAEQASTLYPAAHYATVNSRDLDLLTDAGLSPAHAHFLPNPVALDPTPPAIPNNDPKLIFYPVRGIRRKNLGEIALLAAASEGARFAIAAAPENPECLEHFRDWQRFCEEQRLPIEFDVVQNDTPGLTFDDWYAKADAIITTSVAEGFGLAFLESFARGRPLLGRDLPTVTRDFRANGLRFGSLYSSITFGDIDFASAGLQQQDLIEIFASKSDKFRVQHEKGSTPLMEWVAQNLLGTPSEIAPNRAAIEQHYSAMRYAAKLSQIYAKVLADPATAPEIDREQVRAAFSQARSEQRAGLLKVMRGDVSLETHRHIDRIRQGSAPIAPDPTDLAPQLTPLAGIKAVLFDIYGTLFVSSASSRPIDQLADEITASHARSRAAGEQFPEVDIREIWRAHLGLGDEFESHIEGYAIRKESGHNPVWPMPHLAQTLHRLRDAGLPLGIISNAQFMTPLLFPALLGEELPTLGFEADFCLYSFREGCAKPSPVLFERAAGRLAERDISPGETLFIGNDMLKDVAPAAACGFKTALFAGCARSLRMHDDEPALRDVLPDLIVTDLAQLPAAIGR